MTNNTEEETFRKLKQSPFIVVFNDIVANYGTKPKRAIIKSHHWTFKEYILASKIYADKHL